MHQKNQFLDMQERFPLKIYSTEHSELKITHNVFLGIPEIDHTGKITGTKGRETCSDINFDQCLYEQREDEMRRLTKDRCTVPYTPNNEKVCNDLEDIRKVQLVAMNKFEGHKTGSIGSVDCPMNCKTLFIEFGGKSEIQTDQELPQNVTKSLSRGKIRNVGSKIYESPNIRASFSPVIQKIEEHQLYSFMNLIAEAGKKSLKRNRLAI